MAVIVNPTTNREIHVRTFTIKSIDVQNEYKRSKSAQSVGFMILEQAIDLMKDTVDGDSSERNFGLSVFENALDFRLGMIGIDLWKIAIRDKKHKILRIGISRKGDIYSMQSGRLIN